jgi:hypothetical protein
MGDGKSLSHHYSVLVTNFRKVLVAGDPMQFAAPVEAAEYEDEARDLARRVLLDAPADESRMGELVEQVFSEYFEELPNERVLRTVVTELFDVIGDV